jgi:hemerythrin-like domain-containing protein
MVFAELLIEEHRQIRRAINILNAMTNQVSSEMALDRHDVNALLIFLHYFGDSCHQAKEESILFPALRASEQHVASAHAEHLLDEHTEGRSLIEETQLALFTDNSSEFLKNARKLIAVFSAHATEEEEVLFPLAERLLTREAAAEVAARMEEADAKFGFTQKRLLLDMLQSLELKYLPKAA